MACIAIVSGPPNSQALSLTDRAHLVKSLVDLAASYHPYDPLEARLRGIWAAAAASQPGSARSQSPEGELQEAAWAALQVVTGQAAAGLPVAVEACGPPLQCCHADGCSNRFSESEEAEVCGMCAVAAFCSPACARAARLGRHATCALESLNGASRLGGNSALYLAALMASGRHWLHRLRALHQLALHMGAPQDGSVHTALEPQQLHGPLPWGPQDEDEGTNDNLPPPYVPGVAEVRALGCSGVAPALATLLADVAEQGVARRPWPPQWQWLEDPLPEWGLGSAVPRIVHLINMLTSERPPGCGGAAVWTEAELQRHAAQLARCAAAVESGASGASGSGSGARAVMRGFTELCFNAAADFPWPAARSSCLEAAITLHGLALEAHHPALRTAAAGALSHLNAAGLQALLLAKPPYSSGGVAGAGAGAGGGGSKARQGRREMALGCALRLMGLALAGGQPQGAPAAGEGGGGGRDDGALVAALQSEWPRLLRTLEQLCASFSASSTTGSSSTASTIATQRSLLGALAELLAACRAREGLLRPEQLQAAEELLWGDGIVASGGSAGGELAAKAAMGAASPAPVAPSPAPVALAATAATANARAASPCVHAEASTTAVTVGATRAGSGSPEPSGKVCATCGVVAGAPGVSKLRKCSRCQAVRYCSEACQTAHWAAGHKRECKQLAAARVAGAGGGPVDVD